MNCHRPAAPTFEYAAGLKDDSTCGSTASSAGNPRFASTCAIWVSQAPERVHVALELRRARHGALLGRRRGDDETGGKTRGKEGKPPARSGGRPPDRAMQAVRGPCRVHLHSCKIKVPT